MLLQHLGVIARDKNPDEADRALIIKEVGHGFYTTKINIVEVQPDYRNSSDYAFAIKNLRILKNVLGKYEASKAYEPKKEIQSLQKVDEFIVPELEKLGVNVAPVKGVAWYYSLPTPSGERKKKYVVAVPDEDLIKNYVVVLNLASGQTIRALGASFLANNISDEIWGQIMEHFGNALGKIHFKFATPESIKNLSGGKADLKQVKTTIHGDFKDDNVFYNLKTHQVTLIDVASMVDTLINKDSPLKDIDRMCSSLQEFNRKSKDGAQKFAQGYASAFPEQGRAALEAEIVEKCAPKEAVQSIFDSGPL